MLLRGPQHSPKYYPPSRYFFRFVLCISRPHSHHHSTTHMCLDTLGVPASIPIKLAEVIKQHLPQHMCKPGSPWDPWARPWGDGTHMPSGVPQYLLFGSTVVRTAWPCWEGGCYALQQVLLNRMLTLRSHMISRWQPLQFNVLGGATP